MALLIRGKTQCRLCGQVITETDNVVSFPPITVNEADGLFLFNDGSFHQGCFESHPLALSAQTRFEESRAHFGPGQRRCWSCNLEIVDPDNYFSIGYLGGDISKNLKAFNYLQLHRTCIAGWNQADRLVDALLRSRAEGQLKGAGVASLIDELQTASTSRVVS